MEIYEVKAATDSILLGADSAADAIEAYWAWLEDDWREYLESDEAKKEKTEMPDLADETYRPTSVVLVGKVGNWPIKDAAETASAEERESEAA